MTKKRQHNCSIGEIMETVIIKAQHKAKAKKVGIKHVLLLHLCPNALNILFKKEFYHFLVPFILSL